jgi:hypothetical protein
MQVKAKRRYHIIFIILKIGSQKSGGSWFKATLGRKLMRPNLNRKIWAWWHTPVITATRKHKYHCSQANWGKK